MAVRFSPEQHQSGFFQISNLPESLGCQGHGIDLAKTESLTALRGNFRGPFQLPPELKPGDI